jgi:hypothetical protein
VKLIRFAWLLVLGALFISGVPVFAYSGCCSWHGGVCGNQCCDGSALSAICAPYYPASGAVSSSPSLSWIKTLLILVVIMFGPLLAGFIIIVFSRVLSFIRKLIKKLLS